jgi:hypothetical protein
MDIQKSKCIEKILVKAEDSKLKLVFEFGIDPISCIYSFPIDSTIILGDCQLKWMFVQASMRP